MSCLAAGLRGSPATLRAALSIGWTCDGPRPWHRGCQHSLQHANTVHTINLGHSTGNVYPPACLRDCLLGERGLDWSEQGQSMGAFMSFMFFYVISQHVLCGCWCLREACMLSDQGKISCYFQMALCKRLLWCTKSNLKCACSCLWFFPKKPTGEAWPLGCCHFTFSMAEMLKDSNALTTQRRGKSQPAEYTIYFLCKVENTELQLWILMTRLHPWNNIVFWVKSRVLIICKWNKYNVMVSAAAYRDMESPVQQ